MSMWTSVESLIVYDSTKIRDGVDRPRDALKAIPLPTGTEGPLRIHFAKTGSETDEVNIYGQLRDYDSDHLDELLDYFDEITKKVVVHSGNLEVHQDDGDYYFYYDTALDRFSLSYMGR